MGKGRSSRNLTYDDIARELNCPNTTNSSILEEELRLKQMENEIKDREIAVLKRELQYMRLRYGNGDIVCGATNSRNGANASMANFSFRDIEESLNKFSGEDNYSVETWLIEFEQSASVFQWSEVQKLVYAKRLLSGAAKLSTRSGEDLSTWDQLKNYLKKEFHIKINSATIHKKMADRKKNEDESLQEYFLCMREMGAIGKLEPEAVIKYTVAGINDIESNKILLYGATNYEDFKEKINWYADFKTTSNENQKQQNSKFGDNCYNCGNRGHYGKDCTNLHRGTKCYNCNKFGHLSPNCPQKQRPE